MAFFRQTMFVILHITIVFLLCRDSITNENKSLFYYIDEIGSYSNYKVKNKEIEITDREIQNEIETSLLPYSHSEVTNEKIKEGDIVFLHYFATDGSTISEESDCELIIGDEGADIQFENYLLGKKVHTNIEFSIHYNNLCAHKSWKNKKISFNVVINNVERTVFPSLTESFLKKNFNVETVEEFRAFIKNKINEQKMVDDKEQVLEMFIKEIIETTKFGSGYYSQCRLRYEEVLDSYQKYADINGITVAETLDAFGTTEKELQKKAEYNEAVSEISYYIMSKENLFPIADKMIELKQEYVESYGYSSIKEFIDDNGEQYLNDCIYEQIVSDFLYTKIQFY